MDKHEHDASTVAEWRRQADDDPMHPRPTLLWVLRWTDGQDYFSEIGFDPELASLAPDEIGRLAGRQIANTLKENMD